MVVDVDVVQPERGRRGLATAPAARRRARPDRGRGGPQDDRAREPQGAPGRAHPRGLRHRPDLDARDVPVGGGLHRRPDRGRLPPSTSPSRTRCSPSRSSHDQEVLEVARTRRRDDPTADRGAARARDGSPRRSARRAAGGAQAGRRRSSASSRPRPTRPWRSRRRPTRRSPRTSASSPRRWRQPPRPSRKLEALDRRAHPRAVSPRAASRRSTTARSAGRWRARSPRSSAAPGFTGSRRSGDCAHFHHGHRHRRAERYTPVYAVGRGKVVYSAGTTPTAPTPAWIVIIAHSVEPRDLVRPRRQRRAARSVAGRPVRGKGQLIGLRGHDRPLDRRRPPLGRPARRRVATRGCSCLALTGTRRRSARRRAAAVDRPATGRCYDSRRE